MGKLNHFFILLTMTFCCFAATDRIFVSNEHDNSVSVIDIKTKKVIETIAIGTRPRGIGISPDKDEIYVAVSGENRIAVIDTKTLNVKRSFASGNDPEAFAVHPNGNLYISNEEDAKASVYDPLNGALLAEIEVGIEPEGVAISPDGKRVIVTSESTNMLHLIEVPSHKILQNILVGARPRSACFSPNGKLAYATSEISGEVKKIEVSSGKILNKNSLTNNSAKPKDVLTSLDGSLLYIAGGRANKVFVLNAESLETIKVIPVGKRVWGLALSRDGKTLYSTDGVDNQVSVIDTVSNSRITTIEVGKFPWGIVIDD
ncbi:MAG: PQQ-dependent catabolism-associated beta-propeller protein [Pseudomonadota bacterium]|nr:PQQ-dependent catabolism-associated beta-propeller protein [Pseudomonadota bacterium]